MTSYNKPIIINQQHNLIKYFKIPHVQNHSEKLSQTFNTGFQIAFSNDNSKDIYTKSKNKSKKIKDKIICDCKKCMLDRQFMI